jgi:hypothetical protein
MEQDIPVRLIRGHKTKNSYTGKVYTYDGLYKVRGSILLNLLYLEISRKHSGFFGLMFCLFFSCSSRLKIIGQRKVSQDLLSISSD